MALHHRIAHHARQHLRGWVGQHPIATVLLGLVGVGTIANVLAKPTTNGVPQNPAPVAPKAPPAGA